MIERIIDNLIAWVFFLAFTTAGQKLAPMVLKHFEKMGPPHLISLPQINRGLGIGLENGVQGHNKHR